MSTIRVISAALTPAFTEAAGLSPDEVLRAVIPRFQEAFADEALASGVWEDRILNWMNTKLRQACDASMEGGRMVWEALHDPETRHNVERLAVISSFLAAHYVALPHWPAKEFACLVMLLISLGTKGGGGHAARF